MMEPADLVGQILLGKLEVIRKIGGGGMGVVYEVEHRLTGHRRALKVVHAKYADRPRFMKRLLREAKVAGKLQTPYVVETFDAGRLEDGSAYVLMELLEGRSLYELVQAEGRLAPRRLAAIMSQVAEGMAVAHAAGIVHRDLKPENIFILDSEEGERVKILDFGVSKFDETGDTTGRLTVEGTLVGTPYYMSPEQAAGRTVDERTDIYAMGVMMYEALTGRLPFEAESVGALFVKIGAGEHVPLRLRRPELEEAWFALVDKALHRDPAERFQSAEALRRELVPLIGFGEAAARAKTLSGGARATQVLSADPAPREQERCGNDEEASALSAPPAQPEPEPSPRHSVPPWAYALGGALTVLLLVLPWQLSRAPAESTAMSAPAPPVKARAVEQQAVESVPPEPPPPAPDAGAAVDTAPVRRVRPSRAKAAGLDPNPYR